jgi:hypothetical protein
MNRGNIKIKETNHHQFIVEARLVYGNLWLTKHEIADLFNVTISTVSNSLHSLFKSGILQEKDVSNIHLFDRNGKPCQSTLYNMEALIFISYRVASGEARVFRQWVTNALCEYSGGKKNVSAGEVLVTYNLLKNQPSSIALN